MRRVLRAMLVFGLASSAFDLATFALLVGGLGAGESLFRAAWFVESLLTEIAVLFGIRCPRPLWRSRPASALVATSLLAGVAILALATVPPLVLRLGFEPLSAPLLHALFGLNLL